MEACSRAGTMSSLWALTINLSHIVFRFLPELLSLPPSLVKRFRKDEHVDSPPKELETLVVTLPGLPQDVLEVIFGNLEIPDLVRAGSAQTPCLFYTSKSAGENVACIYSLVEKRVYKLTLPEPPIRTRFLVGSSNGWLITADEGSVLLLHVKPIFDDSGTIHKFELSYYTGEKVYTAPEIYARNDLCEELYFKAFVFPDLSTGSYIVVLIHFSYYQLSFARAGDNKWTWLPPNAGYRDCMYMNGVLYALTEVGEIDAFDLSGSSVTRKIIVGVVKDYIYESMYIIPAPWGGLLQIWRLEDGDAPGILNALEQNDVDSSGHGPAALVKYITQKILVYKVDMAAKELVKINSLPHHLLFLGHNQSLCLGAEEHPQLKANRDANRDIGVLNLENCRRKEIVSKIWSDLPCPAWIVPNLTKMNLSFAK
ncbi:hypothetical protein GQ55_6G076500 [Panicum hallii var. hallii]|uniref:KIB1-4 beta-propeller domain-containing protein n=1 Tax=Panicum hallii var. hallii TaxID=1504633 RepID=A0A2T7D550_9POAL|nr:hypothetical protein GQ55_6G076500 [Panicum hallii var. hallii]